MPASPCVYLPGPTCAGVLVRIKSVARRDRMGIDMAPRALHTAAVVSKRACVQDCWVSVGGELQASSQNMLLSATAIRLFGILQPCMTGLLTYVAVERYCCRANEAHALLNKTVGLLLPWCLHSDG